METYLNVTHEIKLQNIILKVGPYRVVAHVPLEVDKAQLSNLLGASLKMHFDDNFLARFAFFSLENARVFDAIASFKKPSW